MNGLLSNSIAFVIGAGIGVAVSWKLLEYKYKRIADEEIKSVMDAYGKKFEPKKFEPEKFEPKEINPEKIEHEKNMKRYTDLLKENKYSDEEVKADMKTKPHIIAPEEFGENEDYETVSLTHYADGVLTDDQDEPIEDVEKLVGKDFASHFGEYEEDSVFIRNDELNTDYEILRDSRTYND